MEFLASLVQELGGATEVLATIRQANTARHVLELCREAGLIGITTLVCRKVVEHCARHAGGALDVHACLVDFGGALLGRYPELSPASPTGNGTKEAAA
jgi:cobalt-precorrin-5B (C1)-methyltransferase